MAQLGDPCGRGPVLWATAGNDDSQRDGGYGAAGFDHTCADFADDGDAVPAGDGREPGIWLRVRLPDHASGRGGGDDLGDGV